MRKRFLELHRQFQKLLAAYRDSTDLAERTHLLEQMQKLVTETSGLAQKFSDDVELLELHVLRLYSEQAPLRGNAFKQANSHPNAY